MPSSPIYDALKSHLTDGKIDLWLAAQDPVLAGLKIALEKFGIRATFLLSPAAISAPGAPIQVLGVGSYLSPANRAMGVTATLKVDESDHFLLKLAFGGQRTPLTDLFGQQFPDYQTLEDGIKVVDAPSFLLALGVRMLELDGDSDLAPELHTTGLLDAEGILANYQKYLSTWPLNLSGKLALARSTEDVVALDWTAIDPRIRIPFGSNQQLDKVGFSLRSVRDLDLATNGVAALSVLELVGSLAFSKDDPVQLRVPLASSDDTWRLIADLNSTQGNIGSGLTALSGLIGLKPDQLAQPIEFLALDRFYLAQVEVAIQPPEGLLPSAGFENDDASAPLGMRWLGIKIRSDHCWNPPIPFVTVNDVGATWQVSWPDPSAESVWSGSVFGGISLGDANEVNPATGDKTKFTVDVTASLPQFVVAGRLRKAVTLPIGSALTHFFGGEQGRVPTSFPDTPDGLSLTAFSFLADPNTRTFRAQAALSMDWELSPFQSLTFRLVGMSFFVDVSQSSVSGGIAASVQLDNEPAPNGYFPTLTVGAQITRSEGSTQWTFEGGLLPGAPLSLTKMALKLLDVDPRSWSDFPDFSIDTLNFLIKSGTRDPESGKWLGGEYSGDASASVRWAPQILGTTVRISVSVGAKVTKPGKTLELPDPKASGTVTGSFALNQLAMSLAFDFGVPNPTWRFRIQFGQPWVELTTYTTTDQPPHRILTAQLGGVTLGSILEYLVNLAAPTLGYRLDSPWDALNRIDLSRFLLLLDLEASTVELKITLPIDLGVVQIKALGIKYTRGAGLSGVELTLDAQIFGEPKQLGWDVIKDPPPAIPGKGGAAIDLYYLALGQRVRPSDDSPVTVRAYLEALEKAMQPLPPGGNSPPPIGNGVEFAADSEWLIGLDIDLAQTFRLGLLFNDPRLYGLSIALRGGKAGSFDGLDFQLLYKKISDNVGMFRIDLALPVAMRSFTIGPVGITLGVIALEIFTNGNFTVDFGYPWKRDFSRSFTVQYFPFIGRGGVYFGYLNGATSSRVPKVTDGTFNPVIELGVGLAVGIGKEIIMGPLSGGAYVQIEVVFLGVFGWFNPSDHARKATAFFSCNATAAIVGKIYGTVDFKIIKVSVSILLEAEASVAFEVYKATQFRIAARVTAEAEIKILFIKISFSFSVGVSLEFTAGSDSTPPWTLAAPSGGTRTRLPAMRRSLERRLHSQQAFQLQQLRLRNLKRAAGEYWLNFDPKAPIFASKKTLALHLLPAFSITDLPIAWSGTAPTNASPQWRIALLLSAETGIAPAAVTPAERALRSGSLAAADASEQPAHLVIEAFLRWALYAVTKADPTSTPGLVTALQLQQLADQLDLSEAADRSFALDNLGQFFGNSLIWQLAGEPEGSPALLDALLLPLPPQLTLSWTQQVEPRVLSKWNPVGAQYIADIAAYQQRFQPVSSTTGDALLAEVDEQREAFPAYVFRDWCLMLTKTAVKAARDSLDRATVTLSAPASLNEVAARFPTTQVHYRVQGNDSLPMVALALGATVDELLVFNPKLAEQLADAAPGSDLQVSLGVAAALIAHDNPDVKLSAGKFALGTVRANVRQNQGFASLAKLFGLTDAAALATDDVLADVKLLRGGSRVTAAPTPYTFAVDLAPGLGAAVFYARWYETLLNGDDEPLPQADWYAQTLALWNASTLTGLSPAGTIAPGTPLKVPSAYLTDTTAPAGPNYTSLAGDTPLRIGRMLALAQLFPSGNAIDAPAGWNSFRDSVTQSGRVIQLPGSAISVAAGETVNTLGLRTLLHTEGTGINAAALLNWLGDSPVLAPLGSIKILHAEVDTSVYTSFASISSALGPSLSAIGAALADVPALLPASDQSPLVLTIAAVPVQTIETVVTDTLAGSGVADIAGQLSRQTLSGLRLPAPVEKDQIIRAAGAMTAFGDLCGMQIPGPPPGDSTEPTSGISITVERTGQVPWIEFASAATIAGGDSISELQQRYPQAPALNRAWSLRAATDAPPSSGAILRTALIDALSFSYTAADLKKRYPAHSMLLSPTLAPQALPLSTLAPQRFDLEHEVLLQTATPLALPGSQSALTGQPQLYPFPESLRTLAHAGGEGLYEIVLSAPGDSANGKPSVLADATFVAAVRVRIQRAGEQIYTLVGSDADGRQVLLDLIASLGSGAAAYLAIAPDPAAADPSGLSVLDLKSRSDAFLIKTNQSTASVPDNVERTARQLARMDTSTTALDMADLSKVADFAQLLFEGSVVGGTGYFLSLTQRDGGGIAPGAFDSEGRGELWFVVLSAAAQRSAPAGRVLESFVNAALLPPGTDPSAHTLSVISCDDALGNHVATVAPGLAGFRLQLPNPREQASQDPAAPSDIHQLFGLVDYQLGKPSQTYHADLPGLAVYPRNPEASEWQTQRASMRRRARLQEEPAELTAPDWSYSIVLPLYRFGPPSLAPTLPGLPDTDLDPYRGLNDSGTRPSAEFAIGVRDIVGNVAAAADASIVPVETGYTDPLLGPESWPATRLSYTVTGTSPQGLLTLRIEPLPANAWPALGEAPTNARKRAADRAQRYATAWFQWSQPELKVWCGSSLFGTAGERAWSTGPATLWSFVSAQYLNASALASLQPVLPALSTAQSLTALSQQFGFSLAQLATANESTTAHGVLMSQPLLMPAYVQMQEGMTAKQLAAQAPNGVPAIDAETLLKLPANASRLPLRAGTVLAIPQRSLPVLDPVPKLDELAATLNTSARQLGIDNSDREILRDGFSFVIDGVELAVGPETPTLSKVRLAYQMLGVQIDEGQLADAARDYIDLLKPGADVISLHYQVPPPSQERPFETLAQNHSNASIDQLAALNGETVNLFDAGAMVYVRDYIDRQAVAEDDEATLAEWTARFGTSPTQLFQRMAEIGTDLPAGSGLSVPGLLDWGPLPQIAAVVPAATRPVELASRFDYAADPALALRQFVTDQAQMPQLLNIGVGISVGGASTQTLADDTLARVLQRLQQQQTGITLAQLAEAIGADNTLLREGALLSVPPARLSAITSNAELSRRYALPAEAIAAANIGLRGALQAKVPLHSPGPDPITVDTVVDDSWNAVLSRFADRNVVLDLAALIAANPNAPAYRADARLLLPTAAVVLAQALAPASYAEPVFALDVTLRGARPVALIHPDFAGSSVATASAEFQPLGGETEVDAREALAGALRAALPDLRLASGRVPDQGSDLWLIDFGAGGITSASLRPATPGPDGAQWPCFYALRPLYPTLISRSVALPEVQSDGSLKDSSDVSDFVGIDVETWARRYLSDVDRVLSAEQSVALYRDSKARIALGRILTAKRRLAEGTDENGQVRPGLGIAAGLAPVLVLQTGATSEARQAAATALGQSLGISLSGAYASAGLVQYATTADSAWTRNPQLPGARLYGDGLADKASPVAYTLSNARIDLASRSGHAQFVLGVDRISEHRAIAFKPSFVPTHLEWNIRPLSLPGGAGYESSNWLTLIPAFTVSPRILPDSIHIDLGCSEAPIPLRAFPALPSVQGQSAGPSYRQPTQQQIGLWTYSFSYRHEHAAQDELIVALRFNQSLGSAQRLAAQAPDVATALARYVSVADSLFALIGGLGGGRNAVAAEAAWSLSQLIADVASAWSTHFQQRPLKAALGVESESVYWLDVQLEYSPDGKSITSILLTRLPDPEQPSGSPATPAGPDGRWPDLIYQSPDGDSQVLVGEDIRPENLSRRYGFQGGQPPSAQWAQIALGYADLNVAQWQNAIGSVAVVRNRSLITGEATEQDFIYASARVQAPAAITPLLHFGANMDISAPGTPVEALVTAMASVFGNQSPDGLPLSIGIGYGYELAAGNSPTTGLITVLPVHLMPRREWTAALGKTLDEAIATWLKINQPAHSKGFLSFSLTVYSTLQTTSAPLLAIDSLVYRLADGAEASASEECAGD
ncbi:MAG: hypothetical protein AB7E72_01235 [Lysobacterales bacterium]